MTFSWPQASAQWIIKNAPGLTWSFFSSFLLCLHLLWTKSRRVSGFFEKQKTKCVFLLSLASCFHCDVASFSCFYISSFSVPLQQHTTSIYAHIWHSCFIAMVEFYYSFILWNKCLWKRCILAMAVCVSADNSVRTHTSEDINGRSTTAFRSPPFVSCSISRKEITSVMQKSDLCFILAVVTLQSRLNIQKINPATLKLVNVTSVELLNLWDFAGLIVI